MHSASKRRGGSVSGSGGVHSTAAGSSTDDDKLLTGEECFDNRAWRAGITGSGQASSSEGPLTQQQEPQSQQQSQSAVGHWSYDAGQNEYVEPEGICPTCGSSSGLQLQNGFHCIPCHNQQQLATGHWTYDAGCRPDLRHRPGECLFVPSGSSGCLGPPNPSQWRRYGPSGEILTPRGNVLLDSDAQPNPSQRIRYGPRGEALTPRGGWLRDSDYRTFTFEDGDVEMHDEMWQQQRAGQLVKGVALERQITHPSCR